MPIRSAGSWRRRMDSRFGFNPIGFAMRGLPPELPTRGAEYKKSLVEYYTHTMSSMSHTTTAAADQSHRAIRN